MLTQEQILSEVKSKSKQSNCIDSRDFSRLCKFFPAETLSDFGFTLKDGTDWTPLSWTEENILRELKEDVAFGFEKALNQRGISSSLMYEVVKMWLWVLEDDLQNFKSYAQYGLPLFKAVASEYGFKDEIEGFKGNEKRFEEQY